MLKTVQKASEDLIRVMLVDDSAVIRGIMGRMLKSDNDIIIVASVGDGKQAVNSLPSQDVDVIILDIEMPVMDGLTALPKLLQEDPHVKVIVASTLSKRNAEVSIRALNAGAADYIPKPSAGDIAAGDGFRRELLDKVKTLGVARHQQRRGKAAPRGGAAWFPRLFGHPA